MRLVFKENQETNEIRILSVHFHLSFLFGIILHLQWDNSALKHGGSLLPAL